MGEMRTMPALLLTAIDSSGQTRNFFYSNDRPEPGFEFVSSLVKKGAIVLEVKLLDGDQHVILPSEAFSVNSCIDPVSRLEREWQCLLALRVK